MKNDYTDFEVADESGTFSRAIDRGVDQNQAMLYATVQAFGQATGVNLIEKWGEDGLQRNIQQILDNPPEIREWDNVDDFSELGTYLLEVIGEQAPQFGFDAAAAVGGGGVAGIVGKRMLAAQVGKGLKRKLGDVATKAAMDKIKLRGAQVGAGASILGQTVGETQMELDSRGLESPGTALTAGVLKAGLEAFGISKILGLGKRVGMSPAALVKEVAGAAGIEAGTEGTQTIVDFLAVRSEDPTFDPLSEESLGELKEAMIRGAIIGGGVRTGTALAGRGETPTDDPNPEAQQTIDAQYSAMRDPSSAKSVLEVTNGSPMPSNLDEDVIQVPTQNGIALTTDPDIAALIEAEGGSQELMGQLLFAKPEGKEGTDGTVVTSRDADGQPITEVATNQDSVEEDLAVAADMAPEGGSTEVTDTVAALDERMQRVEAEDPIAQFLANGGAIQQIPYDNAQETAARGPTVNVNDTTQDIENSLSADDIVEDVTPQGDLPQEGALAGTDAIVEPPAASGEDTNTEQDDRASTLDRLTKLFESRADETAQQESGFEFKPSYKFDNQAQEDIDRASIQDPTAKFEVKKRGHLDFYVEKKSGFIQNKDEAAAEARRIRDENPDRYVGLQQGSEGYRVITKKLPDQLSGDSRVITHGGVEMTATERVKTGIAEARRLAGVVRRGVQKRTTPASENNKLIAFTDPNGKPVTLQAPSVTNMGLDLNQQDGDKSTRTEVQGAYEGYLTGLAELQRLGYTLVTGGRELAPETIFYSKTRHGGVSILDANQEAEYRVGPITAIRRLSEKVEKGRAIVRDLENSARTPAEESTAQIARERLDVYEAELNKAWADAEESPRRTLADGRTNDDFSEGEARPEPITPLDQTTKEQIDAEVPDAINKVADDTRRREQQKAEKTERDDARKNPERTAPSAPASATEFSEVVKRNAALTSPLAAEDYAGLVIDTGGQVRSASPYDTMADGVPKDPVDLQEAEDALLEAVTLLGGTVGEDKVTLDQTRIILEDRLPSDIEFKDGTKLDPNTKGTVTQGGLYTIIFRRMHSDADDIAATVKHELVGHYGLARFFTEAERRTILDTITKERGSLQAQWEAVDTLYPDVSELGKAEEVFSAIAEDADIATPGILKSITRAVIAALRRLKIIRAKTPADQVKAYVDASVERLKARKAVNPGAPISYLDSAGPAVARVSDVFTGRQIQRGAKILKNIHKGVLRNSVGSFLFTAHGQLKGISPVLAAKIYQDTNSRNTGDAVWTGIDGARGLWYSRLGIALRGHDSDAVKAAFDGLVRELPTDQLTPLGKQLREYIDKYHDEYLAPNLPTLGKIENYFPRLYDTFSIENRTTEFKSILEAHGVRDLDKVVSQLVDMQNPGAVHENRSFMSMTTTVLQQRQLTDPRLIAALVDAGFLNNNPITTLSSYVHSTTKRAEWEKRFGGYQAVEGYTPIAQLEALVPSLKDRQAETNEQVLKRIAMKNDLYPDKELMGKYRDVTEEIKRVTREEGDAAASLVALMVTQGRLEDSANPADVEYTIETMKRFGHMKEKQNGELGLYNPNQKLRKFIIDHDEVTPENYERVKHLVMSSIETAPVDRTTWHYNALGQLRAFESLRVLAMSGVASVPEIASIYARSNQQLSVVEFAKIMKNVSRHYKEYRDFAEDIGAIQQGAAVAMFQEMYGPGVGETSGSKLDMRNLLPHMFKLNGNDFIVNFTKAVGTEAAKQFLKNVGEQAATGDARALRYLASLSPDPSNPITPEQIASWVNNEFAHPDTLTGEDATAAHAAHNAALRFVKEAVLEPNSAERPPWMSHPIGGLVGHLKTYMYTFNKKVMLGMYREVEARAKEGDGSALQSFAFIGAASAMFLFFGALSDELRQRLLSFGEYGTYYRSYQKPDKMVAKWFDRSGLNSLPFLDFFPDTNLRSASFAAGPVFSHLHMLALENPNGDRDALKKILWSLPITSQFYALRREIYEKLEEREATE